MFLTQVLLTSGEKLEMEHAITSVDELGNLLITDASGVEDDMLLLADAWESFLTAAHR